MTTSDALLLRSDYLQRQRHLFRNAVLRVGHDLHALHGGDSALPVEALVYLYAYHWLRRRVPPEVHTEILAASRNPAHAYLTPMLLESPDAGGFALDYLDYWQARGGDDPRAVAVRAWLARHHGSVPEAVTALLALWRQLGWFQETEREGVRRILHRQKAMDAQVLGPEDRQRLALLDGLPDPLSDTPPFAKVGLVPRMTCGAGCRHCQFVWRPRVEPLLPVAHWLAQAQALSPHLLFTGGDLTPDLDLVTEAIRTLHQVRTFALILNGAQARTLEAAREFLARLEAALAARPAGAETAGVVVQVSFDEWHQEIFPDTRGRLRERIPVACIAHLLEAARGFSRIQMVLLHKQERLNFSPELFRQGVLARLGRELRVRGLDMVVDRLTPAPTAKEDPAAPGQEGSLIVEVVFHLEGSPERLFFLVSGTLDRYGRAQRLDPGTWVEERRGVGRFAAGEAMPGQADGDVMLWRDGRVTLFHAPHLALGSLAEESMETLLARWRKDPLRQALVRGDPRLLTWYGQWGGDWRGVVAQASSVPHLLWLLTEEAGARLFLTQALLEADRENPP